MVCVPTVELDGYTHAGRGVLHRDTEDAPWRTVATYDFRENAHPLEFAFDDASIWVASNVGRDRRLPITNRWREHAPRAT